VAITGQTVPEAIIRINGEEIFVDRDGLFSETIVLEAGINTIQIEAKKPRSRTTTLYRQILYELE
jgi:hypothetical protein